MAEKENNVKRLLGRLGGAALALVAAAVIYLAAVLLQSPGVNGQEGYVVEEEREPVTRMQAASMNDAAALARMYGGKLPVLQGYSFNGQGLNASHDGSPARLVTLRYNGVTLSAVRPATAAPLLLHGELDVALRSDLTALNLPAVLAQKGNARCVYFSDETAAYSLYAPEAEEGAFLSLLQRLSWVEP